VPWLERATRARVTTAYHYPHLMTWAGLY
jgi:hypothetical protein